MNQPNPSANPKPVIGFIGTGVMGKSMAANIQAAGYSLHVYTRTRSKAEELLEKGAVWHDTPGSLAAAVDVAITIVGFPKDVEEVYLGENGIVNHIKAGNIAIDMTTSSPRLAWKIYEKAGEKGISALDAPVSGGDIGARDASLSIMVGGEKETFDRVLPLLECMGNNIVYHGPAGSGQSCKISNQIAVASTMMGVCEAICHAEKAGLDPGKVLKSIESGAAGSFLLSKLGPRILKKDFAPGFYVKHFLKDILIALEASEEINFSPRGLATARQLYEEVVADGGEDLGTQALYKCY